MNSAWIRYGDLTVDIKVEKQCNAIIEISNLTGQINYVKAINANSGYNQININDAGINKWSKGMYILRLYIDNIPVSTQKIIKN